MDVKLLEAFRAVVDSRSVTAAAQALGITQPAVVGPDRQARGERRLRAVRARRRPAEADARRPAVLCRGDAACWARSTASPRPPRRSARARSGRLVIASHPAAAISMLPPLVADFVAERPGVSVRLVSRHSDVVSQLLPTEGYDLGIAELPVDETAVRLVRYQMRCVAILPPRHALAVAQAADAGAAVGPADGRAGALAADAEPRLRHVRRRRRADQRGGRGGVLRLLLRAGGGRHRLVAGRSRCRRRASAISAWSRGRSSPR